MDTLHMLSEFLFGNEQSLAIIPTVLIPLTGVTVLLTSLATVVAGWFGIKLKAEGPKQLLEVLLKKKVLATAMLLNLAVWGVYRGYLYIDTLPSFMATIKFYNVNKSVPSSALFANDTGRGHDYFYEEGKDQQNGGYFLKEKWTQKFEKGFFRSGATSGTSVFLGSDDGYVYEIHSGTGKTVRTFFGGTQVTTRPLIFNSRLYFGEGNHETHHARIYTYDLKTGKFLKAFSTKGHTEGQPLIATYKNETLLFVTAGSDGLYAVNPADLTTRWHAQDGHIDSTVSVSEGVVYAGHGKEKGDAASIPHAVAYDFSTGKIIWKSELPLSNWMHAIVGEETVCYPLGEIYIVSHVGLLHCLDKKTGKALYSLPFDAPLTGKPLLLESAERELIVVATNKGEVCAVNLKSKEKQWCQQTGSGNEKIFSFSSPAYDSKRGIIWYASQDNGLYGFESLSGKKIVHWLPEANGAYKWGRTTASVTIADDALYIADLEGVVRRINIE